MLYYTLLGTYYAYGLLWYNSCLYLFLGMYQAKGIGEGIGKGIDILESLGEGIGGEGWL
jgi:hypothetical protein